MTTTTTNPLHPLADLFAACHAAGQAGRGWRSLSLAFQLGWSHACGRTMSGAVLPPGQELPADPVARASCAVAAADACSQQVATDAARAAWRAGGQARSRCADAAAAPSREAAPLTWPEVVRSLLESVAPGCTGDDGE
jgi:hypothetical protein